ncbi:hypothetical protein D918_04502 [Trichuris suis]|nr:hypothetical protein D918_04502 [Trichuris suis]
MAVQGQADSGGANDGWRQWLTSLKFPKSDGEGWTRVTDMLTKGFLVGAFIAGSREMPWAKQRFKEQHALSLFSSRAEVAGRLNNYMLITFWKVGGRVGVRGSLPGEPLLEQRIDFPEGFAHPLPPVYPTPRLLPYAIIKSCCLSGISVVCIYPLLLMTKMSLDEWYKYIREEHYRQEL